MNDKCSNCGIRDATHDGYCGPCAIELAREHAQRMWNYPPGRDMDREIEYMEYLEDQDNN
jgi:hypothetical protein